MFCSISGEQCREPVVTPAGRIYDRRALENALEETPGKDPVSGEDLQMEDVIAIKPGKEAGPVAPRPPSASSIPGMCVLFQNEWDALMLETFELKKQLDQTRQELAQALYQQDASCRVIARLIRERDEARSALTNVRLAGPEVGAGAGPTEITTEIKVAMETLSKRLMSERKKRAAPATLAKADDISNYVELSSHPIHRASEPGILCVDIHPGKGELGDRIVTGGVDKQAVLFNKKTGKKVATLTGHTKKVTSVLFHHSQDAIFTASPDKTVRIWGSTPAGYETVNKIRSHSDAVTGIALHPSGDYLISSSLDETWGFHDVKSGNTLLKAKTNKPVNCARFHADGILVGTATSDGLVQLWDVKDNVKNVAKIQAHKGEAKSITFSENGFYMGSCGSDNVVKMWDLRKIAKSEGEMQSFKLPDSDITPEKVVFDHSGIYLACAGDHVRVFVAKTLKPVVTLSGHAGASTDVKFGPDSQFLATTSMDRTLRFWGLDSDAMSV